MRRYNKWAGNPQGVKEDISRCIAEVASFPRTMFAQCGRKRGHGDGGLYCKQHTRMKVKYGSVNEPKDEQ